MVDGRLLRFAIFCVLNEASNFMSVNIGFGAVFAENICLLFSERDVKVQECQNCFTSGVRPVCATTGLRADEWSSNLVHSLGVCSSNALSILVQPSKEYTPQRHERQSSSVHRKRQTVAEITIKIQILNPAPMKRALNSEEEEIVNTLSSKTLAVRVDFVM